MRFYILTILFFTSSLGFAQKYLGDLPQEERTCLKQNQVLDSVTAAEKKGLIHQVKNEDGTISHIELTKRCIDIIEKNAGDIRSTTIGGTVLLTVGVAAFFGGIAVESSNALSVFLMVSGIGMAISGGVLLAIVPESLGGTNSFLEGIATNPVTILNESPNAACFEINNNYPEFPQDAKHSVDALISTLNKLIKLDHTN